mmetsp:Transcript_35809/g.79703  ORF Transcript_35809/g.79703 Transcript_35809/m.79703 type:complete len:243 (-) Transcript_35809:27-755(-)
MMSAWLAASGCQCRFAAGASDKTLMKWPHYNLHPDPTPDALLLGGSSRRGLGLLQVHARGQTLLTPCGLALPGGLVLSTTGLKLVLNGLLADLLSLLLVHSLHQHTLVLEHVTLDLHVQVVVQVLVNLLGIAVLLQQATQDAHTPDPEDLSGQTSLPGTTALTVASVTALCLGLSGAACTGARVNLGWLPDDKAILHQLPDVLPRVCHRDLIDLIGVQPDLAQAASQHACGKPLLQLEGHHG